MRQFGIISSSIWRSRRFRQLEADLARLVYIYLHTSKHGNSAGAFQLPPELAALDLKRDPEDVRKAFDDLAEVNLIRYDPEEELLQITGFFRFNAITSRKHLAGPMRIVRDALPHSKVRDYAAAEMAVNLFERAQTWENSVDAKSAFLDAASKLIRDFKLHEILTDLDLEEDLLIALSEALLIDLPIQQTRKQHGHNTITDTDTTQHNTDTDRGSGGKVSAIEPPSSPPGGRRSARNTPEDIQQTIKSLGAK